MIKLDSKIVKYLLLGIGLTYVFWPWDIIPDGAGVLGKLDDFLVLVFLYRRYRAYLSRNFQRAARPKTAHDRPNTNWDAPWENRRSERAGDTPYEILGVDKNANRRDIRQAYVKLAHQYHPDKVNNLSDERKRQALRKMQDIQLAYEELKKVANG